MAVRSNGSTKFSNRSAVCRKMRRHTNGFAQTRRFVATNSMILHEFYFHNLGCDGKAAESLCELIKTHYGTYEAWEQDFRLIGISLGGGSGWVILNYNARDNAVHNYWSPRPYAKPGVGNSRAGDGHVRALISDGLRREREGLHRRVFPEHQLGCGEPPRRRRAASQVKRRKRNAMGNAPVDWVNRLATAWLIRRFIDPQAVFLFVEPDRGSRHPTT